MEVYIYSDHVFGSLYVSDSPIDDEALYCDDCGCSDFLVLHTKSLWEVKEWLHSQFDVFGLGGYSEEHLKEVLKKCEDILGEE